MKRIVWAVVVLILIVAVTSVAIVLIRSGDRSDQEKSASAALKSLASAEADFRANDRDWNHVNDYWTGDVKGLYTMTSGAVPGAGGPPKDPSIKLIEVRLAAADADGVMVPAGGENLPLSVYALPDARQGYWYAALQLDLTVSGMEESTYQQDTAGSPAMGKCHNTSKFGFLSFPDSPGEGKFVFIINENNTIFRSAVTVPVRLGGAVPPGLRGIAPKYLNWPDDRELLGSNPPLYQGKD